MDNNDSLTGIVEYAKLLGNVATLFVYPVIPPDIDSKNDNDVDDRNDHSCRDEEFVEIRKTSRVEQKKTDGIKVIVM